MKRAVTYPGVHNAQHRGNEQIIASWCFFFLGRLISGHRKSFLLTQVHCTFRSSFATTTAAKRTFQISSALYLETYRLLISKRYSCYSAEAAQYLFGYPAPFLADQYLLGTYSISSAPRWLELTARLPKTLKLW